MAANTHKINTNLYSDKAFEMLNSVIGQLSDGIWENSPGMSKYWRFAAIKRADNKHVIIEISKDDCIRTTSNHYNHYIQNAFLEMSDAEVIKWFAAKLKQIVKIEMNACSSYGDSIGAWKRDNENTLSYLGHKHVITVKDVYAIYDFLNGRSTAKYDNANELIGRSSSYEETQAAAKKRKQLEAAYVVYNASCKEIDAWEKAEIERIKKEANAKRHDALTTYNTKCKEL